MSSSILKEISPGCSLEGVMLKLKLQSHLMPRANSFEKTLMLGKIEGGRRRERDGWMASLTQWTEFESTPGVGDGQGSLACCSP